MNKREHVPLRSQPQHPNATPDPSYPLLEPHRPKTNPITVQATSKTGAAESRGISDSKTAVRRAAQKRRYEGRRKDGNTKGGAAKQKEGQRALSPSRLRGTHVMC